jgi:glycosyltransferase involved in cell wall biosynthesis
MLNEPVSNDLNNPLISVLIFDYYEKYLEQCLDSIFNQDELNNIEVIFLENSVSERAWNIAFDYALEYKGLMTVKRNGNYSSYDSFNEIKNGYRDCSMLANGKYLAILRGDEAFIPEYVRQCVATMEKDPFASFSNVRPKTQIPAVWPNVNGTPLVNILIHNYNYGRYLEQCLNSVFSQTYDNIGVIFSDNCSTDESWDIALQFLRSHPNELTLIRNRKNFGAAVNLSNCYSFIDAKYFCVLCSDDAYEPDFVGKCAHVLEANPDCGFAMTHRAIVDERGHQIEEPPFYNESCLIPGPEQAAVYMMASVNPSISQIMYNRSKAFSQLPGQSVTSRWFAQRLLDFDLCCNYSMAYIKEPLLINRVHSSSDMSQVSASLVEPFGNFMLTHQFVEMASRKENMEKAIGRLPDALAKLSRLCMRYCMRALDEGDEGIGLRYYHLSAAIMSEIKDDPVFKELKRYWVAEEYNEKRSIIETLIATDNLPIRTVSYDPPPGSVAILEDKKR